MESELYQDSFLEERSVGFKEYSCSLAGSSIIYLLALSISYLYLTFHINGISVDSMTQMNPDSFTLICDLSFAAISVCYFAWVFVVKGKTRSIFKTVVRWLAVLILTAFTVFMTLKIAEAYPELGDWKGDDYVGWIKPLGNNQYESNMINPARVYMNLVLFGGFIPCFCLAFFMFIRNKEKNKKYPCSIFDIFEIIVLSFSLLSVTQLGGLFYIPFIVATVFMIVWKIIGISKEKSMTATGLSIFLIFSMLLLSVAFGPANAEMSRRGGGPVTIHSALFLGSLFWYFLAGIYGICLIIYRKLKSRNH